MKEESMKKKWKEIEGKEKEVRLQRVYRMEEKLNLIGIKHCYFGKTIEK